MEHWKVTVSAPQLDGEWWVRADTGSRAIALVVRRLKRNGWHDLPELGRFKAVKVDRRVTTERVFMERIG